MHILASSGKIDHKTAHNILWASFTLSASHPLILSAQGLILDIHVVFYTQDRFTVFIISQHVSWIKPSEPLYSEHI
jgi:hypothetical protein